MTTGQDFPLPLAPAHHKRLRKILREFHVRAFGEELARINFLPEKQRKQAVAEMIDHAGRKGVKLTRPALGVTP
ncbi:MAG: hypothetical protein WEB60_07340 [Terrimicrobiaceae bacterium]